MKIRSGFVSNSSSASFIVSTDLSIDELYKSLISDYCYSWLDKAEFKDVLKEELKILHGYVKDDEEEEFFKMDRERYLERIKILLGYLTELEKMEWSDTRLVKMVLEYHRIVVGDGTKGAFLSSWTSMHNTTDDMGEIMQSIIAHLVMRGRQVSCRVDGE